MSVAVPQGAFELGCGRSPEGRIESRPGGYSFAPRLTAKPRMFDVEHGPPPAANRTCRRHGAGAAHDQLPRRGGVAGLAVLAARHGRRAAAGACGATALLLFLPWSGGGACLRAWNAMPEIWKGHESDPHRFRSAEHARGPRNGTGQLPPSVRGKACGHLAEAGRSLTSNRRAADVPRGAKKWGTILQLALPARAEGASRAQNSP